MTPAELQRLREAYANWLAREESEDGYGSDSIFDCIICHQTCHLHQDCDPTAFCDLCAQGAVPTLLDEVERLQADVARMSADGDRTQTIADEAFGPFPTEPTDTCLTYIERGIFELRRQAYASDAEGYARAVADVVAWMRKPFLREMMGGSQAAAHLSDMIEHGAHVGAAGERL